MNEKGLSISVSAPAAALSYWQIAVNDDAELHGDCTRMYVVCMYQIDEKGFVCMHQPKKNDRNTLTVSAPGNNT